MGSLRQVVIYMLLKLKTLDNEVFVVVGSIIPREVVEIINLKETAKQSLGDFLSGERISSPRTL
jgi:hypothetical protein